MYKLNTVSADDRWHNLLKKFSLQPCTSIHAMCKSPPPPHLPLNSNLSFKMQFRVRNFLYSVIYSQNSALMCDKFSALCHVLTKSLNNDIFRNSTIFSMFLPTEIYRNLKIIAEANKLVNISIIFIIILIWITFFKWMNCSAKSGKNSRFQISKIEL